jgi:hypothetical protein
MELQVQISDAQSAANVYAAMARFGAPAKLPTNAAEFTSRLKRISGRGRVLAISLQAFVDSKGFDALAEAVGRSQKNPSTSIQRDRSSLPAWAQVNSRTDNEAAATGSSLKFGELDDTPLMFAASGMY